MGFGKREGNGRLPKREVDARFAQIAAELDDDISDKASLDELAAGLLDAGPNESCAPPGSPRSIRPEGGTSWGGKSQDLAGPGPRDWSLSEEAQALLDAEDQFQPPTPPRVRGRWQVTLGWALVAGIPALGVLLLILQNAITGFRVPVWLGWLGAAGIVAGLVLLFASMPARRVDDDETGAVV